MTLEGARHLVAALTALIDEVDGWGIVAQLIGTLLLVGFVLKYWWLIALVLAAVAAWKYVPKVWAGHQATVAAEQRRLAAIAARADQQHQWVSPVTREAPTAPRSLVATQANRTPAHRV